MKKYVSIIAMVLCVFALNVNNMYAGNNAKTFKTTDCKCCKKCKDDKCKELCKKWSNMTAEAQKGEEGQKVKAECLKICAEKKCCSPSGTCPGMEGKGCCKKK